MASTRPPSWYQMPPVQPPHRASAPLGIIWAPLPQKAFGALVGSGRSRWSRTWRYLELQLRSALVG